MPTKSEALALLRTCRNFIHQSARVGDPFPALKLTDKVDRFLKPKVKVKTKRK